MASEAATASEEIDAFFQPLHSPSAAFPLAAELDPADGAVDDGDIHAAINSFLALPNSFWDSSLPPFLSADLSPMNKSAQAAGEAPSCGAPEKGDGKRKRDDVTESDTTQEMSGSREMMDCDATARMEKHSKRGTAEAKGRSEPVLSERGSKQLAHACRSDSKATKQQRRQTKAQQNAKILSALLTALASLDQNPSADDSAPTTPAAAAAPNKRRKTCDGGAAAPRRDAAAAASATVHLARDDSLAASPAASRTLRVEGNAGGLVSAVATQCGTMGAGGRPGETRTRTTSLPGLKSPGGEGKRRGGSSPPVLRHCTVETKGGKAKEDHSDGGALAEGGDTCRSLLESFMAELPEIDGHLDAVMAALTSAAATEGGETCGGGGRGGGGEGGGGLEGGAAAAATAPCAAAGRRESVPVANGTPAFATNGPTPARKESSPQPSSHLSPPHTPVHHQSPNPAHPGKKLLFLSEECSNGDGHEEDDDRMSTGSIDSVDAAAAAAAAAALAMRMRRRKAGIQGEGEEVQQAAQVDRRSMEKRAGHRPPPLLLPGSITPACDNSPLSLRTPFTPGEATTPATGVSTPRNGWRQPGTPVSPYFLSPQDANPSVGHMGAVGETARESGFAFDLPFLHASSGAAAGDDVDEWMPRSRGRKERQVAGGRIKARSMAERQRRERISEGLQKLRMVVRGHGDTATMLDNACSYVEALQKRVTSLETSMLLHRASCKMNGDGCDPSIEAASPV